MTRISEAAQGVAPARGLPPQKPERVSAIAVALLAIGFSIWVLLTLPIQAAVILALASAVAWVGWIKTTYAHPIQSRKVVAVYLGAVAFQFIHMSEEYTGRFPHEIVALFDSPRDWSEKSFLLTFVFAFGALWVLAAAGALYQIRIANYMLWFYALGAGLINAISHFVFPVIKGGYFPGLYTAGGHLIMSALLIYLLVAESRELKAEAAGVVRPVSSKASSSTGRLLPMTSDYDVLVIGSDEASREAGIAAARLGLRVVVADARDDDAEPRPSSAMLPTRPA